MTANSAPAPAFGPLDAATLEERQVLRVGAVKPRVIDVRFLAATNRDLEAEIENGKAIAKEIQPFALAA